MTFHVTQSLPTANYTPNGAAAPIAAPTGTFFRLQVTAASSQWCGFRPFDSKHASNPERFTASMCMGAAAACTDAEIVDLDEKKFRFMLNQVTFYRLYFCFLPHALKRGTRSNRLLRSIEQQGGKLESRWCCYSIRFARSDEGIGM